MSSATRSKSSNTPSSTMSMDDVEGLVRRLLKPILKSIEKLPTAEHLDNKFTELHTNMVEKLNEQEGRIQKLEERIDVLEGKISFLENSITLQNRHVDDLEQYGRRQCLRLYGIQTAEKETADDVLVKVKEVVSELGVEIPDSAFDRAHRIGRVYEDDKGNK